MITSTHAAVLVAVMSFVTILLRGLPFLVFRKKVPAWIAYLGKVLPPAIIGMLVVYCLKNTSVTTAPYGLPELIAVLIVIVLHVWKRNSLVSILSGTVSYMLLIQVIH